jgi:inner membrane transporter RhtA
MVPSPSGARQSPGSRKPAIPATWLVLLAVLSVQLGSAVAKNLFASVGPGGASFLRVGFAAVVLLAIWRPRLSDHAPRHVVMALTFGLATAVMNTCFYLALDRIPLGIAVTLEFVGPLGVAVAGSRRVLDLLWVMLAAAGIVLLTPWGGIGLDPVGVGFALAAGGCWAGYILLGARIGKAFPGGRGLALAMLAAAVVLAPVGVASAGVHLLRPGLLAAGFAVALLSSVIPYSLEIEALRSLPTRVFGILMSLEPGVAAVIGLVVLGQVLNTRTVAAIGLVSIASLGASMPGQIAATPAT